MQKRVTWTILLIAILGLAASMVCRNSRPDQITTVTATSHAERDGARRNSVTLARLRPEDRLGFLPKEKQAAVSEIETGFEAKVHALLAGKARPTREDLEHYRQFEGDCRAELAAVLSPQEYQAYERRDSSTAEHLRRTMGDFETTAQDFERVIPHQAQQPPHGELLRKSS